ncbi:MAG: hypothetical protein JWN48_496 [Myxococcaceae bacterium]|nr:hypothetical protein [Myxococcaceae bacterium]
MTVYCGSSTSRSRPTTFMIVTGGGVEHVPEPVSPHESVETLDDDLDQLDEPWAVDPGLPLVRPSRKRIQQQDHDGAP